MKSVVIDVLLVVGVVVQVGAALGVVLMRNVYQRLHYSASATTVGPFAIAAAVIVQESFSASGLQALLVAVTLIVGGALGVHAIGRAAFVRGRNGWRITPTEVERDAR